MTLTTPEIRVAARLIRVTGLVQGVGFRPFVHRLAMRHGASGWVRNASGSVEIWLEAPAPVLDRFLADLQDEAPPLARIGSVAVEVRPPVRGRGFKILESVIEPGARHFTGQGVRSRKGGASSGRIITFRITVAENSSAIMMPGRMPAMNRSPIEVSVMTP